MAYGERVKIYWNKTLAWAVTYGSSGYAMALSSDSSYLIAGSYFSPDLNLGKLKSIDGTVMDSYSTSIYDSYMYIFTKDTRALCISEGGWF